MLHWKTSQVHWTTSQAMVNMAPLFRVLVQHLLPRFNRGQLVDAHLTTREAILNHLNRNIVAAQERIKLQDDKKRTDRECFVDDWVFLRLVPYKHKSLATRRNLKLSPRIFTPFKVIQKLGEVPYKLDLPFHFKPIAILQRRMKKLQDQGVSAVLIQWQGTQEEDAT